VYGYAVPSDGYISSIINWVKSRYNLDVKPEEITYIPGIVRGIALVVDYFTNPGDKVLIQPPVYHPFKNISVGNNRIVVENPLIQNPDGSYSMDIEGLEKVVKAEHPRLMILCNPHNPAGIQWDENTLRKVARIASENDMIVISDEIHGDLMLDGKRHISFPTVSREAEKVSIVFGAPSKTFNIAGLVSSWAVIKNPEIRDGFFHWLEVNEFNAPTFFATIATEAAYNESADWLDALLEYLSGTVDFMQQWFVENLPQVKVLRPDASFLVWLDFRELGLDHDNLVSIITNDAHLAMNDGAMFGAEGSGFMRFNIGTQRQVVKEALDQLKKALCDAQIVK
ncbi:MAG: PatB family C-S lyase, partial [Muribaculaceae bacterium]|nr:PatB family C-S lyase [Muribaculaceae bacterium]